MTILQQKRDELSAKQAALAAIFEEAGPELDLAKVRSLGGDSAAKVAEIQRLNKELVAIGDEVRQLAELEETAVVVKQIGEDLERPRRLPHPERRDGSNGYHGPHSEDAMGSSRGRKSIGELFVEAKGHVKRGSSGPLVTLPDVDIKTTMTTAAGWAPESLRGPRIELTAERALAVSDLPMLSETTQASVSWMKEVTFTNNAAEVAEGGTYGEGAVQMEEDSELVRKIAVFLPITDEQLEDEARVRDYVNNRLTRMVRARLDSQILSGNGSSPNLTGVLNVSGVQTQALGSDALLDCVYKGIIKVQHTGHANPDAVVLHPGDWQQIRLTRSADGIYVWGHPSESGREQVWGIPVVINSAISEGTGVVGAWREFSELAIRRGLDIQVSNSHDDYFTKGIQAIRADMRCALIVYRPAAFVKLTSI